MLLNLDRLSTWPSCPPFLVGFSKQEFRGTETKACEKSGFFSLSRNPEKLSRDSAVAVRKLSHHCVLVTVPSLIHSDLGWSQFCDPRNHSLSCGFPMPIPYKYLLLKYSTTVLMDCSICFLRGLNRQSWHCDPPHAALTGNKPSAGPLPFLLLKCPSPTALAQTVVTPLAQSSLT